MSDTPSMSLSVRIEHATQGQAAGRRRHDLRIGRQPAYVDGDRADENSVILATPTPAVLRRECEARRSQRETVRRMRSDAAVMTSSIITWGRGLQPHVEALSREEQDDLHQAVAEAVAAHCGSDLVGLVVHRDETALHGHGAMPAVRLDGTPISKGLSPAVLSAMQDVAMTAASRWLPMIKPPIRKTARIARGDDASAIYHRSVRQLHDDLPKEIEAREVELRVAEDRVAEMEGRVAKARAAAQGNDVKAEKAAKRLATYERRLAARQEELLAAEAKISATQTAQADIDLRVEAAVADGVQRGISQGVDIVCAVVRDDIRIKDERIQVAPALRPVLRPIWPSISKTVVSIIGWWQGVSRPEREAIRDRMDRDDGPVL